MKELTQKDFQYYFEQLKIRKKRCKDRARVYIERDDN